MGRYLKVLCIHVDLNQKALKLYQIDKSSVNLVGSLDIATNDPVALNFVDNLIVVHNLTSKVSLLFDIKDNNVVLNKVKKPHIYPLCGALQLAPFEVKDNNGEEKAIEIYCISWKYIAPHFILDKTTGYMWKIGLNLNDISLGIYYHFIQVQFYANFSLLFLFQFGLYNFSLNLLFYSKSTIYFNNKKNNINFINQHLQEILLD